MCITKVIAFCDFKSFYAKYKPLTPYGNAHKESMPFYTEAIDLDSINKGVEHLKAFIKSDESSAIKVEHHLSRIDVLNTLDKVNFDAVDIQLIKKFLIHVKAINKHLTLELKQKIDFTSSSLDLLTTLMPNNDQSESFYLSSDFNKELGQVREQILNTDKELNILRQASLEEIKSQYGIDLFDRDFVLIDKNRIKDIDNSMLVSEFYDSKYIKVKAAYKKAYLDALVRKEEFLIKESEVEKVVLKQLSSAIIKATPQLKQDIEKVTQLDVLMAKARLAINYKLTKPEYTAEQIQVEEGIFYPLFEKHQEKNLRYTPLNGQFADNAILLSGSNMGGKTVLFKTLAFLQLLTQMGFYVPASRFSTSLFTEIQVMGASESNAVEGLSSFGQEIHQLTTGLTKGTSRLLFVDELAKTTNATEAKAILYAVLKYIANHPAIKGFFSTHFIKVPNIEGVGKFRMNGLDKEAYLKHCDKQCENINDKIRQVNAYMQYEVSVDDGNNQAYDALTIAKILGLQNEIIEYANDYLDN